MKRQIALALAVTAVTTLLGAAQAVAAPASGSLAATESGPATRVLPPTAPAGASAPFRAAFEACAKAEAKRYTRMGVHRAHAYVRKSMTQSIAAECASKALPFATLTDIPAMRPIDADNSGWAVDEQRLSRLFEGSGHTAVQKEWFKRYVFDGMSNQEAYDRAISENPNETPYQADQRERQEAQDRAAAESLAREEARDAARIHQWEQREAAMAYAEAHGFHMYNCTTNPDGFTPEEEAILDSLFPGWTDWLHSPA